MIRMDEKDWWEGWMRRFMLRMDEKVWLEGLMIRLEDKIKWDEKNVWTHRKFIGQVRRENNGKKVECEVVNVA